ncbi:broad-complex core protein isoforms 1/2/3/4/5 [Procambarus clarkii]|uniref:broad-complex core protein isoforms 1/2/3/4/5 n=1 Tax=Procambarus clarkii TaxID=6728 RepID=UPI003742A99B
MSDRMLVLSWKNHSSTFSSVISTLREKENYTDVTVACEGKFYPAHKLVLAACSEYFEEIFQQTSCKHPVIVLKDITCKDVNALFSYMYQGVASVSQNDLTSLLKAAESLRVKGLAVPDGLPSHATDTRPGSSLSNDVASPKPKKRKKEENISPVPVNDDATFSSNKIRESCSQSDTSYNHESRRTLEEEQITGEGEEGVNGVNTSVNAADHLAVGNNNQIARKSELECTPDMPFKDIFNETAVKEEIVDSPEDRADLSYNSEIDYHALSDGGGQVGESEGGGLEDHMTQGYHPKYEAPDVNERNVSQDTPGYVGSLPSDTSDHHNPGPSRMSQNIVDGYDGFMGLESYSCDTQQELYNQLASHLSLQNHPPHQAMIQNNSNELFRHRGRPPKDSSQMYSEKKMHRCTHCNYSTPWHSVFIRHCRRHSGEKPFSCAFCPFRSSRKSVVNRHCMSKHSQVDAV